MWISSVCGCGALNPKPNPIHTQVRCLSCGHDSNTYEAFSSLSLDIAKGGGSCSLEDSLTLFTAPEMLEGANK